MRRRMVADSLPCVDNTNPGGEMPVGAQIRRQIRQERALVFQTSLYLSFNQDSYLSPVHR